MERIVGARRAGVGGDMVDREARELKTKRTTISRSQPSRVKVKRYSTSPPPPHKTPHSKPNQKLGSKDAKAGGTGSRNQSKTKASNRRKRRLVRWNKPKEPSPLISGRKNNVGKDRDDIELMFLKNRNEWRESG